ncbi:MAG: ABC transporter permease subunit [Planctomycetota bacterium]
MPASPPAAPPPAPPPDASPPAAYFDLPPFVLWPAALLLLVLGAFFLTGLISTLLQPVDPGATAHVPLAGAWALTWHSVVFSLLAATLSTGLALPAALHLRARPPSRSLLIALAAGFAAVPWIVSATGWSQSHSLFGAWGHEFEQMVKTPTDAMEPVRLCIAAVMQGCMGLPLAVLMLATLMPHLTHEEEAALLVGNRWQVFLSITWPECFLPTLASFAVLLLWHFNELNVCDLMRVNTWSTRVFITTAGLSPPLAMREYSVMAVINGIGAMVLLFALVRVARRRSVERLDFDPARAPALRLPTWLAVLGWTVVLGLGCAWPFVVLVARLGIGPHLDVAHVFATVKDATGWWLQGVEVSFASGVLAMLGGLALGLLCLSTEALFRRSAYGLAVLFLALSSIGISLPLKNLAQHMTAFLILDRLRDAHFYDVLACACRALPWCMMLTVWHLYALPRRFDEAARAEGAGPSEVFLEVLLPYLRPLILPAFFVGFALASLDLVPAVLLSPPGRQTLIVTLFNELHYDYNASLVVLALMLALPFPVLAVPIVWSFRRRLSDESPPGPPTRPEDGTAAITDDWSSSNRGPGDSA